MEHEPVMKEGQRKNEPIDEGLETTKSGDNLQGKESFRTDVRSSIQREVKREDIGT